MSVGEEREREREGERGRERERERERERWREREIWCKAASTGLRRHLHGGVCC